MLGPGTNSGTRRMVGCCSWCRAELRELRVYMCVYVCTHTESSAEKILNNWQNWLFQILWPSCVHSSDSETAGGQGVRRLHRAGRKGALRWAYLFMEDAQQSVPF